jgi:hypothetical protein
MAVEDMVWHKDGHSLTLQISKENLVVLDVSCSGGVCQHKVGCIVQWFVRRYGFDCNVGVCDPERVLEIAWMVAGDPDDVETCQVWFIPVKDEAFSAWLATQPSISES